MFILHYQILVVRPKRKKAKELEAGNEVTIRPPPNPLQEEAKGAPEVLEVSAGGPPSILQHTGPKSLTGGTRV
jgi:hypothetical protein